MKNRNYAMLLSCSLLVSCNSMNSSVDETRNAQEETVIKEVGLAPTLQHFQGKNWLWQGSYYNNDTQLEPVNPVLYQVTFSPKEKLYIIADCNRANTTYSEVRKSIVINENYISTRAYCGDSSLDNQYLHDLMRVNYWMISKGKLILELNGHAGRMEFKLNKE